MKIVQGLGLRRLARYDLPRGMASDPEVSPAGKLVWMVLADLAFGCEQVFCSYKRIGNRCGLSEATVKRAIVGNGKRDGKTLVEAGWVHVEHRPGHTSVYSVDAPERYFLDPGQSDLGTQVNLTSPPQVNLTYESLHPESVHLSPSPPVSPSAPVVGSSKKKSPRGSKFAPSEVIDAFRKASKDPDFSPKSGPSLGALKHLNSLDNVQDLDEYAALVPEMFRKRGLTLTFRAFVNAAEWIFQTIEQDESNEPTGPAYEPWKGITNGAGK